MNGRPRTTGSTILVVEDHPLNRELVVDFLEAAGYTVHQGEDGRRLLARVRAERPDIVLLDLQLPDMDGFAPARQLMAEPSTRRIPLPAMSAYARPEEEALAAGFTGFVAKALDNRAFLCTVARLL